MTLTAEERNEVQARAKELRAQSKRGRTKADGQAEVLAKIAEMPDADRAIAERLHAIVEEHAPMLIPKTWYGMPAYAKDGAVVCFFQAADKFKARYATIGFNDAATLDDGTMWPTSFAVTSLTKAAEGTLVELVRRAVG